VKFCIKLPHKHKYKENIKYFYTLKIRTWCKVKGKGKVAPVLNYAPRDKDVLGKWRYRDTYS